MALPHGSHIRLPISFAVLLLGGMVVGACGTAHSGQPNDGSSGNAGKGSHGPAAGSSGRAGMAAASGEGGAEAGSGGRAAGSGGRAGVAGESSPAGRGGSHAPTETTFVVRNDGEDALMLGSSCNASWPSLFEGDNELGLVNSCSCPCADRSACGCPAICINTQELVVPGTSVSKTWGGTALDYSTDVTRNCYVERVPAHGTKLEVRACWNYGDRGAPDACSAQWFAYGQDTTVTITAKPALASSKPTKVALNNTTDAPIYVVKNHCGAQAWFRLDMGKEISINTGCACSCGANFRAAVCPSCGQCAQDVIEAIAPGETTTFEWDSRFWYQYDGGGCSAHYDMPSGSRVKVQFCWSKTAGGAPSCQSTFVDVGAASVLSAD